MDRHPDCDPKALYMQIWMHFRNHFRLGSYKQLPQEKMAEAVAYLAGLVINEKKQPAKKEASLPPAYVPLAERGRETMERLMTLRRDISQTSMAVMEIMQYAAHHGNEPALDETQTKFSRELGSSVCTFFMCINNNLIAVEHMYRAFCEAEKLIYG